MSRRSPSRELPLRQTLQLALVRALAAALSRFGQAHVWLMYRRPLDVPLGDYRARVPLEIGIADDDAIDELTAMIHPGDPAGAAARADIYRERMRQGSLCFVARVDGAIVGSNWIRVRTAVGAHQLRMQFADDEIYTTDAHTAQAWRGKGIHPALNHAMLVHAQQRGIRIAYTLVHADNDLSWVTMPRIGWQLAATMLRFDRSGSHAGARERWLVIGDPYPMPLARGLSTAGRAAEDEATAPVPERVPAPVLDLSPYPRREQVSDLPWARTYRLSNDSGVAWLVIVPQQHAGVLLATVLLAERFPDHLPPVIACDHREHGWLLSGDHGGRPLTADAGADDLGALLETYAKLQAAAVAEPVLLASLPATPTEQPLQRLLAFLRGDDQPAPGGGAAAVIGEADSRRFEALLAAATPNLQRWLEQPLALPDTIDHGDLQPAHAAISPAGAVILFDWTRASRGPAGLSLHRFFGGIVPALRALQPPPGDDPVRHLHRMLMDRHIGALAAAGYAAESQLRRSLPAAIVTGAIVDLLRMIEMADDDGAHLPLLRQRLEEGLDELGALCAEPELVGGP